MLLSINNISNNSCLLYTSNNIAREKLDTDRIELAYDRDNKTIRIKALDEGGMEIRKTKVFGKGFFNQFGIVQKGKFEARFDPDERSLYVELP